MRWLLSLLVFAVPAFAVDYVDSTVLLLDVGASTLTVTNSGAGAATPFTAHFNPGSGRIKVWLNHGYIPLRGSGSSCGNPCSITANLNYGPMDVWYEKVDASGNPFTPAQLSASPDSQIPEVLATPTATCCVLPIEVLGTDNYVTPAYSFTVAGGTTVTGITAAITIFSYAWTIGQYVTLPKGAFRINGGAWIDLSCPGNMVDENRFFGCYNGPQTVLLNIAVPDGSIVVGANTVEFRLYPSDGNSSGYRILGINFIQTIKTFSSISVTSNVATVGLTSHGYSTGDTLLVYNAPGMKGRFGGLRQITVTGANAFTFTACGSNPNLLNCTSPNATDPVPTSRNTSLQPQPVASVARALIPASAFSWSTSYSAPAGGNAGAGQTLFETAALKTSNDPYFAFSIGATCNECHPSGGEDLKYFNYSNLSIVTRSLFHGLSVQDGNNIAAYIRGKSIATPTLGQPWNPPYQPGQTISSNSVNNWSAGAGIDAVTTYSEDSKEYMAPGGSLSGWAYGSVLDPREIPQQWQFPAWNLWLPRIYPGDYYPTFAASTVASDASTQLAAVKASNTVGSYCAFDGCRFLNHLSDDTGTFLVSVGKSVQPPTARWYRPSVWAIAEYSVAQWAAVKAWEVLKVYAYEASCDTLYTTQGKASTLGIGRCWGPSNRFIFNTAPHITQIQAVGPTNDNQGNFDYLSNDWYNVTIANGNGNGWSNTSDVQYSMSFLDGQGGYRPDGWQRWAPAIYEMQQAALDTLPNITLNGQLWAVLQAFNVNTPKALLFTPVADVQAQMQFHASQLLAVINNYSGANWTTWSTNSVYPNNNSCNGATLGFTDAFMAWAELGRTGCDSIALFLPVWAYYGVDSTTINAIQAWAAGLWPTHDFTIDRAATFTAFDATGTFPIFSNNHS